MADLNLENIKDILHKKLTEEVNYTSGNPSDDVVTEKRSGPFKPREDRGEESSLTKQKTEENPSYAMLRHVLKGDLINNAAIAYKLFPDLDKSTARSLFRKKLFQKETGESDLKYKFSEDELKNAVSILNNLASSITGSDD